jgi:hypothetical protein
VVPGAARRLEEAREARELIPTADSAEEREFFTEEAQEAEKRVES